MSKINLDKTKQQIETVRDKAEQKLNKLIQDVFLSVGKEWQAKHPKRHLKLIAGMGAAFWTIDGEILHTDYQMYSSDSWFTISYKNEISCSWDGWKNFGICDHEKEAQFKDLALAFHWLNDVLTRDEYMDRYLCDMDFKNNLKIILV